MLKIRQLWDVEGLKQVLKETPEEQVFSIFPWGGCLVMIYRDEVKHVQVPVTIRPQVTVFPDAGSVAVNEQSRVDIPKSKRPRLTLQDVESGAQG